MKLKVISYNKKEDYHICDCEDGTNRRIDIMVDGTFMEGTTPESLIGNTYEVDRLIPYVEIACGVNSKPFK